MTPERRAVRAYWNSGIVKAAGATLLPLLVLNLAGVARVSSWPWVLEFGWPFQ